MPKFIIDPCIEAEISQSADYIRPQNPEAASRLISAAHEAIRWIAETPLAGRPRFTGSKDTDLRSWRIPENLSVFISFTGRFGRHPSHPHLSQRPRPGRLVWRRVAAQSTRSYFLACRRGNRQRVPMGQNRGQAVLPDYHPQTVIREWGNGQGFRLADALTGVAVFGATGSGKTSGPAKHLAYGYLAAGFGGLVLCAKKEECRQWQRWAAETNRAGDLVIVNQSGNQRFNFLDSRRSARRKAGAFPSISSTCSMKSPGRLPAAPGRARAAAATSSGRTHSII